jgi:hypothetical protein
MFIGISTALSSVRRFISPYVKSGLKLYYRFLNRDDNPISHASTGSTSFDGTDDYVDLGTPLSYTNHTFAGWINSVDNGSSSAKTFIDTRDAGNDGVIIYTSSSQSVVYRLNDSQLISANGYPSEWIHIACTYDGTTQKLYINGSLDQSATTSQVLSTVIDATIGARGFTSRAFFFSGSIANVGIWSRALSASEVQGIMYKKYADLGSVDKASLVSWWGLDVDYTDSHGSNDGTNSGSTLTNSVYGDNAPQIPRILDVAQPKQAVQLADGSTSFDGTDDYIDLGVSPRALVGSSSAFSVSAWINMDDDTNEYICGAMESGAERFYFRVVDNSGTGYMKWGYGDTASSDQLAPISLNQWHYVVWTYDTTNAKVYVDGSLKYTTAVSGKTITNTDNLYIGALNNNGSVTNYLDGSLANVSIHSSALTQTQIQELMFTEKYAGLSADLRNNLVSWYDMGDTSLGSELVSNGTFDSGISGWSSYNYTTAYQSDSIGGKSNVLKAPNSGAYSRVFPSSGNLVVGKTYILTFEVYHDTGSANALHLYLDTGSDSQTTISASQAGQTWASFEKTFTATTTNFGIGFDGTATDYFDNISVKEVQVEDLEGSNDGSIYGATTTTGYTSSPHGVVDPINYGTLKSGTALSFDGTNDYVDCGSAFQSTFRDSFSISMWVNATDGQEAQYRVLFGARNADESDWVQGDLYNGTIRFVFKANTNSVISASSAVLSDGITGWKHIVFIADGVNMITYLDGSAIKTTSMSGVTMSEYTSADEIWIGARDQNDVAQLFFDGKISNVKIFNSALTESEIQEMYLNPEQILPTGVSSSNLKLYLPMNEGVGTYTYDGSGNQNHGTISGATWDTANTDIAQVGLVRQNSPMVFDGSDDKVTLGSVVSLSQSSNYTLSAWFLTSNSSSGGSNRLQNALFSESSGYQHDFGIDGGKLTWHNYDGAWQKRQGATTVSDGDWHHGVLIHNSDMTVDIYLDGSLDLDGADGTSQVPFTLDLIGRNSTYGNYFNGLINEVAIWDEALDADAVTALYNSGTPLDATTDSGNYDNSDRLQGYWRNDNDTTWIDRANTGVASFDGTDDYLSLGTPYSYTNNTFSAWIKPEANSSADRRIIDTTDANDDGVLLYVRGDSDKIQYAVNGSGLQSASTYNGQWVHIVGTYDGSTQKLYINGSLDQSTSTSQTISTTTNAIIGARSFTSQTTPFKGQISGTHVFDVALSASEVSELYAIDKRASISGHSKFSDCVGSWLMGADSNDTASTIQDQTSENNDATVSGATLVGYNDGTVSDTSVASIVLTEGITSGRDSQGFYLKDTTENCLTLNGAEYVEVPDSEVLSLTTSATWELWMNQSVIDLKQAVISKDTSTTNLISFYTWDDGNFYFDIRDGSTQYGYFNYSTAISADAWHHLTVVFDGSLSGNANRLKVYVDSVQQTLTFSGTMPSTLPTVASPQMIGNMNSSWTTTGLFNGKIDDVRIYSDALSSDEVTKNYNAGKSKHS